jgi:hypothetical protein
MKVIPSIAIGINKYLGINLTKEAKYIYNRNYKTLMNEFEGGYTQKEIYLCSWSRRICIVKMSILSKAISNSKSIKCNNVYQNNNDFFQN